MNRERWHRIERACSAALASPAPEREAVLDRTCAGDPDLRAEVEQLLREQERAERLLDVPAWHAAAAAFVAEGPELPLTLAPGHRLGPYEIEELVGSGGMGEVYRARDTRLDRRVAVKVLSSGPPAGSDRRQLEIEARAASALNHPHVCTLFDVGSDGGIDFLVMEYLEGETLAERVRANALPLADTLRIGKEVAEGLAAAHRLGIVHRDLKPANVMLTRAGAKLLDFGVARRKTFLAPGTPSATSPEPAPEWAVLGSVNYMSPEQLGGDEPDARTDLFAFGALLYEMLTGRRLFAGSSPAGVIVAILATEAPDMTGIQSIAPPGLLRLIKGCLEKDPDRRWDSARLAADELQRLLSEPGGASGAREGAEPPPPATGGRRGRRVRWLAPAGVGVLVLIAGALAWRSVTRDADPAPLQRLDLDLGPQLHVHPRGATPLLSPDGSRLVFTGRDSAGRWHLYVRMLSDGSTRSLYDGAVGYPFFSPDSRWVGFIEGDRLLKVNVAGGAAVEVAKAAEAAARGASWGDDGAIVAALNATGGLSRIPPGGGTWAPLTRPRGSETHRWPQVLPGSHVVVFTSSPIAARFDDAAIEAVVVRTGERKVLRRGGYFGRYVPSGHLVFVRHHTLFALPMDLERLEAAGPPVPVVDPVIADSQMGLFEFSFSQGGHALSLTGTWGPSPCVPAWREQGGGLRHLPVPPGQYSDPRLSPDGRRLCMAVRQGTGRQMVVFELGRESAPTRLVSEAVDLSPVWAPDGEHLAYGSDAETGVPNLFWRRADGAGTVQRLTRSGNLQYASSFSRDGRLLAYAEFDPATGSDVWLLPLDLADPDHPRPGPPQPLARTAAMEELPALSPDGRWLAYSSDETGRREIYVRAVTGGPESWQVTREGGDSPLWGRNGGSLLYQWRDQVMVVDIAVRGGAIAAGSPRAWSAWQLSRTQEVDYIRKFDPSPDGRRLLILTPAEERPGASRPALTLFLHFFDELRRRVPVGR